MNTQQATAKENHILPQKPMNPQDHPAGGRNDVS